MTEQSKIDLNRYRTNELASKVAEILSVPESIRIVLKTTLFAILLLVVANTLLYAAGNRVLIPWLVSTIYALAVAIVLGFALGLIRVATLLVSRSEALLKLTLETSREVSRDYQAVRSGGSRMPTATEIVEHVYDGVVLPAMETSVAKSFGVVGKPLLWIYRRTIGGCVRFLITRMKTASLTVEKHEKIEAETDGLMRDVAENASNIESAIKHALGYTEYASKMLRRVFLIPVQLVFGLAVVLSLVPLTICWFWAG